MRTKTTADPVVEDAVHRVQQGDREAGALLFDRYHEPLTRWAERKTGDRVLAQDVVAETWMLALRRIDSYTFAPDKGFAAWIFTIARNVVTDNYRKASRRNEWSADLNDFDTASPDNVDDQATDRVLVENMLKSLKKRERQLLLMHSYMGMSHADIAQVLGLRDEGAARVAHWRAVQKAKEFLPARNTPPAGRVVPRRPSTTRKESAGDLTPRTASGS